MAGKKRLNPKAEAIIAFVVVILAAALAAFVKSSATGQPFSLDWGLTLIAAAGCAAVLYLGPALLFHFKTGAKRANGENQGK